jgi:hypothetical protein
MAFAESFYLQFDHSRPFEQLEACYQCDEDAQHLVRVVTARLKQARWFYDEWVKQRDKKHGLKDRLLGRKKLKDAKLGDTRVVRCLGRYNTIETVRCNIPLALDSTTGRSRDGMPFFSSVHRLGSGLLTRRRDQVDLLCFCGAIAASESANPPADRTSKANGCQRHSRGSRRPRSSSTVDISQGCRGFGAGVHSASPLLETTHPLQALLSSCSVHSREPQIQLHATKSCAWFGLLVERLVAVS